MKFLKYPIKTVRSLGYYPYKLIFKLIRANKSKTIYQVYGMKRSGNHAIIEWISRNEKGWVLHCNHIKKGQHPLEAIQKRIKLRKGKPVLITSYEEYASKKFQLDFNEKIFGRATSKFNILILRDPFNLFASRYAWKHDKKFNEPGKHRDRKIKIWKSNAKLFLDWEANPDDSMNIPINYNRWCVDENYKNQIAERLSLTQANSDINQIQRFGGGSSFTGTAKIDDKKVLLQRFLKLANNEDFKSIFEDKELLNLSQNIFGAIEGVERIIKSYDL